MPVQPQAQKTPDELIADLIASGVDPAELQRKVRAGKVAKVRNHFLAFLKDDNNADCVGLTVSDWRSIREFIKEPPTQDANPGGQVFDDILLDTKDAIEDKDAGRLIHNLLLIYKAVRRG